MPGWIELDGLVNLRDVGGIPTIDGGSIRNGALLRSDNLQDLTDADIATLVDHGLTDVVDLRTDFEVASTGPGPLTRVTGVTIHHHSLFVEATDGRAEVDDPDVAPEPLPGTATVDPHPENGSATSSAELDERTLPWVGLAPSEPHDNPMTSHYLSYLVDRPDSVLAALRVIAEAPGATLVHCAAGKDRTGTIVALALLVADADPAAVIDDYAATATRMQAIVDRLMSTNVYRANLEGRPLTDHLPQPETMRDVIRHIQTAWGGVDALLTSFGWTAADTQRLRRKLR